VNLRVLAPWWFKKIALENHEVSKSTKKHKEN